MPRRLARTVPSLQQAVAFTEGEATLKGWSERKAEQVFERRKRAESFARTLQVYLYSYGETYTRADRDKAAADLKRKLRTQYGFVQYVFWIRLALSLVAFFVDAYFSDFRPQDLVEGEPEWVRRAARSPENGEFVDFSGTVAGLAPLSKPQLDSLDSLSAEELADV